jgi:putative two-component system response regulator
VGVLAGGGKPATAAGGALSSYDTQMIEAAGRYLSALVRSSCLYAAQQAMFVGTVRAMTAAIDAKDHYTRGHSERVAMLARRLALATGADEAEADAVHIAGLLHDVGKIGVPEAVLCKQGRLSDEEFAFIRAHPEIGVRILRDIPALAGAMPGVLHHHERYDGKGYPTGLAGEAIPRVARLLAVADAFDAMSSTRSYRAAMPREKVLEQVRKGAGSQFDPTIAQAMLGVDLTDYDAMVLAAGAGQAPELQTAPSRAA